MASVFVSYSRADLVHVLSVVSALRQAGMEIWIDIENLKPGERWKGAIETALANADAMIFCLSPLSVESAWTSVELDIALRQGVLIIPLMVQYVPLERLPPAVRERHIFDMGVWPSDKASVRAAKAIMAAIVTDDKPQLAELDYDDTIYATVWISMGRWLPEREAVSRLSTRSGHIGQLRHWRIKSMSPPVLADILAASKNAIQAIITVDEYAEPRAVNVLLGAVAAVLGEWRVTVVEPAGKCLFKDSAAWSRARYLSNTLAPLAYVDLEEASYMRINNPSS